ncbi:MAG: hypothetical protein ABSH20_20190 [Tepidisphaeraceae bacterium]|jgi:hypothetical protein
MTEAEFINSIDCRFPYENPKKASALAARALKISPNAVFMVYHELARPGRGFRSSKKERLAILEFLEERFVHPLSGLASWLTRNMIAEKELSVARAAAAMRVIADFPGCYNALNLAYFSCDDKLGKNERLVDLIWKRWEE